MNRIEQSLMEALIKSLEQWSFFMVEPTMGKSRWAIHDRCFKANIVFEGNGRKGSIDVMAPLKWCEKLARNVIGLEDDAPITLEQSKDALSELTNLTGGHYLTNEYGDGPVFKMGVPDITEASLEEWLKISDLPNSFQVLAEDQVILASIEDGEKKI